jgi:hypothetical protein
MGSKENAKLKGGRSIGDDAAKYFKIIFMEMRKRKKASKSQLEDLKLLGLQKKKAQLQQEWGVEKQIGGCEMRGHEQTQNKKRKYTGKGCGNVPQKQPPLEPPED